MHIKSGAMHFFFDGQLLGCRSIRLKVPLFLFDIRGDTIIVEPAYHGIFHNVRRIIVKAVRCIKTNKVINACCTTIC